MNKFTTARVSSASTMKARFHSLRFLTLLALAFTATIARAQPAPAGRVLLYTEPRFRGECLEVPVDTVIENLELVRDSRGRPFNERIASLKVEGAARISLFEHSRFRGAVLILTRSVADLGEVSLGQRDAATWDRVLSSLRVEPQASGSAAYFVWEPRDAERALRAAYRDILGRDPDDKGARYFRGRMLDAGWSEEQVRDAIRDSDEFRNRDVGAIIRRAYKETLGREVDPSGLATYTRALQRGMSEGQLRAELAHSREGREFAARQAITRAYREILRRDPDPEGLAGHLRNMLDRGWDEDRVRDALRRSDEYRRLPKR